MKQLKKLLIALLSVFVLAACSESEPETVEGVIESVVSDEYEVKEEGNGKVSITITDEDAHAGSKPKLLKDSAEILAGLSKVDITAASIQWHAKLTDAAGNENFAEVYGINFEEAEFKEVNWENYENVDLETVATDTRQSDALN